MTTNIDPVGNLSSSLIWKLRYLEWLFLAVHLLLAVTIGGDKLIVNIAVYCIFIVLSWILPVHRYLKFRQAYILFAMVCIVWANFIGVSLDLLVYLYIAKSFFLVGSKSTIYITIATGIGWIASECFSEMEEVRQSSVSFEPPFGFGNFNFNTIFVLSLGLYVAVSIFVIFLSSAIVAEHKSRQRAEALAEQVEILAKNLERNRIARDIHDSLGHTLTNLDIQIKVAQKLRDRDLDRAFQAVDMVATLSAQCIEDVSHAVQTMRRNDFDLELALNNLLEQINYGDRVKKVQWEIDLPQLSLSTSHQIYCVVKEGLINIQKHASASQVNFQGYSTDKQIILKLEDNGVGFDLQQVDSGFGLQGMRERVEVIGGTFKIRSAPDKGTQILVTISQ